MNYKNFLLSAFIVISSCYAPAAQAMMSPTPAQGQQTATHQGFKPTYIERRFWNISVEIEGKPYIMQIGHVNQYLINCASQHMNAIIQLSNHLITNSGRLSDIERQQYTQMFINHNAEYNRIIDSINKTTKWLGLNR